MIKLFLLSLSLVIFFTGCSQKQVFPWFEKNEEFKKAKPKPVVKKPKPKYVVKPKQSHSFYY